MGTHAGRLRFNASLQGSHSTAQRWGCPSTPTDQEARRASANGSNPRHGPRNPPTGTFPPVPTLQQLQYLKTPSRNPHDHFPLPLLCGSEECAASLQVVEGG